MININEIGSLENLCNHASIISKITNEDIAIGVSDTEKFIKYCPSETLDLPIKEGSLLPEGSALKKSMQLKQSISNIIPKEIYGVSFRSTCNPIVDEHGNVIGGITFSKNLELRNNLLETSENLSNSLEEISTTISTVASNAQVLADVHDTVMEYSKEVKNSMQETAQVLDIIKGIANKTNMIGLNAAIEASRAGEYGRGFSVVANEIRKLSASSNEAVEKINEILQKAIDSVTRIVDEIQKTNDSTQEQAATTEEINASVEELSSISKMLIELGKGI